LKLRYSLLKYYYMLFVEGNGTGSVMKPLFFEFPTDAKLFDLQSEVTEDQFMIGSGLMVSPVLCSRCDTVDTYFPSDRWFDYHSGRMLNDVGNEGKTEEIEAPLSAPIPLFIRGGHVVHYQSVEGVLSTADLNNEYMLKVALTKGEEGGEYKASGKILGVSSFEEDHVKKQCKMGNCVVIIEVVAKIEEGVMEIDIEFYAQDPSFRIEEIKIVEIVFYGLPEGVSLDKAKVEVNQEGSVKFQGKNNQVSLSELVVKQNLIISITNSL